MTAYDMPPLILAAAAGLLIGWMFFGGLLWTVRRALASPSPALWVFASLLLRTGLALAGFYLVAGPHWARWAACLLGFTVARLVVTRLSHSPAASTVTPSAESSHAP